MNVAFQHQFKYVHFTCWTNLAVALSLFILIEAVAASDRQTISPRTLVTGPADKLSGIGDGLTLGTIVAWIAGSCHRCVRRAVAEKAGVTWSALAFGLQVVAVTVCAVATWLRNVSAGRAEIT